MIAQPQRPKPQTRQRVTFGPVEVLPSRIFGRKHVWQSDCRQYLVTMHPEGSGRYVAIQLVNGHQQLISVHRLLTAAMRACQKAARRPVVDLRAYVRPRRRRGHAPSD